MTKIEWTETVLNPVRGCSRVSAGCENCYAERMAHRFSGPGQPYEGLTRLTKKGPGWTGDVRFVPEMLDAPLRWRKPRMVFVNSMSDLFHEKVSVEQIAAVFGVMAACPQHTFQVLTKRPARMLEWFRWIDDLAREDDGDISFRHALAHGYRDATCDGSSESEDAQFWKMRTDILEAHFDRPRAEPPWPLPNVWIGVSVENQAVANERIPLLLQTPAAVRWVSAEPLLGPLDHLEEFFDDDFVRGDYGAQGTLDWVVVGGESGRKARPCNVEWVRSIVGQCRAAEVPVFVKQMGARVFDSSLSPVSDHRSAGGMNHPFDYPECVVRMRHHKGANPEEWPEDLRVREWPEVEA